MDRSFEIRPVPDAQVRSGPVRSGPVFGPRSVRVQGSAEHRKTLKNLRDRQKHRENFAVFFSNLLFDDNLFAKSVQMYPNVSECVTTDLNRLENVKKLRENVEKLRETVEMFVCSIPYANT